MTLATLSAQDLDRARAISLARLRALEADAAAQSSAAVLVPRWYWIAAALFVMAGTIVGALS